MRNLMQALKLPTSWWKKLVLFGLSTFFIYTGIHHFVNPGFYLSIMPPAFPLHTEAVYISGFFEVVGGVCVLIPRLRKIAGWGLVALLVAVRSEEHTSELQSLVNLVCRLLLEKKKEDKRRHESK